MFENPGKKIKSLAVVVFVVNVIACLILAFALGTDSYYYYGSHTEFNGLFYLFFFVGPPASYVECLFLYGFGELIENSAKTDAMKQADYEAAEAEKAKKEQEAHEKENTVEEQSRGERNETADDSSEDTNNKAETE